jgi:hypothetical protein
VTNGRSADADFVLAVMENYRGEPTTHEVLKRVVSKYPKIMPLKSRGDLRETSRILAKETIRV